MKLKLSAAGPLCVVASLLLVACHPSPRTGNDSQIAVKVGAGEISVFQVQESIKRRPELAGLSASEAKRMALENLVDQELAAQAARTEGIDQDPAFVQALELGKRELLAQTYQQRIAAQVAAPSDVDIDRFYADNPAMFSERKLYALQEYFVRGSDDAAAVDKLARTATTADQVTAVLERAGLKVSARRLVKGADELSPAQLDALKALKPGESITSPVRGATMVYLLLGTEPAPLDRAAAAPMISAYLRARQREALVGKRMEVLRKTTPIAVATAPTPPSSAARRSSRTATVGLEMRL